MQDVSTLSCPLNARMLQRIASICIGLGLFSPVMAIAHEGHDHNAETELQRVLLKMGLDAEGNPLPKSTQPSPSPTLPQSPAGAPVVVPSQSTDPTPDLPGLEPPRIEPSVVPTAPPIAPAPPANSTPVEASPLTDPIPTAPSTPATKALSKSEGAATKSIDLAAPPLTPKPELLAQATNQCASIDANALYVIQSRSSNQVLDVYGRSTANSAQVIQWPRTNGPNQQWSFQSTNSGYYRIAAQHSGQVLHVTGASQQNGALIVQFPVNGATNQEWCLRAVGSGYYQLVARHSGQVLDVPGASQQQGVQMIQWPSGNAANQQWSLSPVGTVQSKGQWSSKISFPSVPVAAALLPNGKVLTWSSWDRLTFGGANTDKTYTALFDPSTNQVTESLVTNTQHDMFCPGTAMLADGRVLVNGGGPYVPNTSLFNANTNSWTRSGDMAQKRWYNVSVTLENGNVFTLGGNRVTGLDGRGERWNGSTWRTLPGAVMTPLLTNAVENRSQEHPHMFLAPNGRVFIPGPTPNMQWYDVSGNGTIQAAGQLGTEVKQNGTYTMYDVGKILVAGGNPNYDGANAAQTPSSAKAYIVNINNGVQTQAVASMQYPRAFANSVVLPDGKVLVVGGINNGQAFSDTGAILTPELFDPATNTWTDLAPMATPRTYHSVALLLPDGRVFAGGGGLCGNCTVNHPDAEIFTPPYLQKGARPTLSSTPGAVGYAQAFTVTGSTGITKFTLIRASSVTHSVNTDQRFMQVAFTSNQAGTYRLNLNSNANITPPGYYMLFGLNAQGVPSVAKMIKVGL